MSITHERQGKIYFEPLNFILVKAERERDKISVSKKINDLLKKDYAANYTSNEKKQLREFFERNLK